MISGLNEIDSWPADGRARVLYPRSADRRDGLCDYAAALALQEQLIGRPPEAPDLLLVLEHPPVVTLGRSGGEDSLLGAQWRDPQGQIVEVAVHRVARGGKITMHAPGQLVIYPLLQLPLLQEPVGRGPLGDLPAYVRLLEAQIQATCGFFGLQTQTRPGFSGVWLDDQRKLASIGVAVRHGWSSHGLALNVDPPLDLFELMVPCGLQGARLTSMAVELRALGRPVPTLAEVAADLAARLRTALLRRGLPPGTVGGTGAGS